MKLYHFNPNNYGQEYFVMSDSEQSAIVSLNNFLKTNEDEYRWPFSWGKYTIDVYEANNVVQSEIA